MKIIPTPRLVEEKLCESGYIPKEDFAEVHGDCQELLRILVASTKTLQGKNLNVE